MEHNSQVAQLRQRIEEEYTAAQRALHAPAMVAKHEFITKRMEGMQQAHEELQAIVGEEEAIKLVAATLENIPEARTV
jgi:hypothetical protein